MKNIAIKYILIAIILALSILFIAFFAGPNILKLYIEAGVGDCRKIPILCMGPTEEIINPAIDKEYLAGLRPFRFPKIEIYVPNGLTVIREKITKVYYKKYKRPQGGAVVYVLRKDPDFFMNLYPQLRKEGIDSDYAFIRRTMYAKLSEIKNLTDTFFVILKGVFIPDLGDQKNAKMALFEIGDKRGFINYNLAKPDNYFDCDIIEEGKGFFKVYIKDRGATLNLNNVLAIISTIRSTE